MSAHGVGRRDMGASRDAALTRRIQNAFARPHAPTNSPAVSVMSVPTAIYSVSVGNRVTKNLFEEHMADEEGNIDFLETQLELIRQVGVQLYAPRNIGGLGEASEAT